MEVWPQVVRRGSCEEDVTWLVWICGILGQMNVENMVERCKMVGSAGGDDQWCGFCHRSEEGWDWMCWNDWSRGWKENTIKYQFAMFSCVSKLGDPSPTHTPIFGWVSKRSCKHPELWDTPLLMCILLGVEMTYQISLFLVYDVTEPWGSCWLRRCRTLRGEELARQILTLLETQFCNSTEL